MAMHRLVAADSLQKGEMKPLTVEGHYLLLVHGETGPALVSGICPHAGGDLGQGEVVGNRIRCPVHKYLFDLTTGSCAAGRREGWGPLAVYDLQVIDGFLCADV